MRKFIKKFKEENHLDWNETFANIVYDDVEKHKCFITNLGKCEGISKLRL